MQGIIPSSETPTLGSVVPALGSDFSSVLSDAKGILIGLAVLTVVLKVIGLLSSCFNCFLVQCLFKVVFVFVSFSWSLHGALTESGLMPSMWLCSLYSIMPSILFTIAIVGAQFVAMFLPLSAFITESLTILVAAVIITFVLKYSTQQLGSRLQGGTYEDTLWNFYR